MENLVVALEAEGQRDDMHALLDCPVNSFGYVLCCAATVSSEHFADVEAYTVSDAARRTRDDSGAVRPVAVAVV